MWLALIPSRSLSDVGSFFWGWILKDCIKVQEKKKKVVGLCSCPPLNMKLGSRVCAVTENCAARAELLFCVLNLMLLWRSRWIRRSRFKPPFTNRRRLLCSTELSSQIATFHIVYEYIRHWIDTAINALTLSENWSSYRNSIKLSVL